MPFVKRFEQIIQKTPVIPSEKQLLINSHKISLIILITLSIVLTIQHGSFSQRYFNHAVAWTSVILIGLSFALSGICYFWNFADRQILYRKHLGIAGFHYASIHFILTLYLLSKRSNIFNYFASPDHFWPFFFGIIGLIYFSFMTAISNKHAAHEIGGLRWRQLLRLGYVAFAFGIMHIFLLRWGDYVEWWGGGKYIPSVGIILMTFALLVLLLRIALSISVHFKKI